MYLMERKVVTKFIQAVTFLISYVSQKREHTKIKRNILLLHIFQSNYDMCLYFLGWAPQQIQGQRFLNLVENTFQVELIFLVSCHLPLPFLHVILELTMISATHNTTSTLFHLTSRYMLKSCCLFKLQACMNPIMDSVLHIPTRCTTFTKSVVQWSNCDALIYSQQESRSMGDFKTKEEQTSDCVSIILYYRYSFFLICQVQIKSILQAQSVRTPSLKGSTSSARKLQGTCSVTHSVPYQFELNFFTKIQFMCSGQYF